MEGHTTTLAKSANKANKGKINEKGKDKANRGVADESVFRNNLNFCRFLHRHRAPLKLFGAIQTHSKNDGS